MILIILRLRKEKDQTMDAAEITNIKKNIINKFIKIN